MPSEKVLEAKKAQVAETVEILKAAQTGVLVDYRGLNVEEDTELRRKLREANVKYFVIKNTLLRLAAKEVGLDALDKTQLHLQRLLLILLRKTISLKLRQVSWTAL